MFKKKKKDITSSPALTAEPYPHLYGSISRQQLIYPLKKGKGATAFTLAETLSCHCEEVAEQPTWQSRENKILDCFTFVRNDKKCKCAFTLAEKDPTQNPPLILGEGEIVGEFMSHTSSGRVKKCAFTLAETLIVLVILGVIASITIPAVVRRQMEAQNRTKLKKCMTVYDTALNKMVIENGLKSNRALTDWGNNNECVNTKQYFKVTQDDKNGNNCVFKSADGVWWNIEDINHPIVAFNEDDLNKANEENNKAFKLVGYLDDSGILRVGDLVSATGDNKTALSKLYNFINNKKTTEVAQNSTPRLKRVCDSYGKCSEYDERGNLINGCYLDQPGCVHNGVYDSNNNLIKQCSSENDCSYFTYDSNGNKTADGSSCTGTDISSCSRKSYYTYDSNGNQTASGSGCTGTDISSCSYKYAYTYDSNGNKTGEGNSCTGTDINSCRNKYVYTYDENGNQTAEGSSCKGSDISSCSGKYAYTYDSNGNKTAYGYSCKGTDISSCSAKYYYTYDSNGNQTAVGSGCKGTDISSCSYKFAYTYDSNGNQTASGSSCTGTDISSCSSKQYFTYDSNGNRTASGSICTGTDISSCSSKYYYTYDSNGNKTAEGYSCSGTDISSCSGVTTYTYEYWGD